MCSCSLLLIFALEATSISHLLTATIKFSWRFLPTKLASFVFFISHSSSFSVLQVNITVLTMIEILLKERIGFVIVVLFL